MPWYVPSNSGSKIFAFSRLISKGVLGTVVQQPTALTWDLFDWDIPAPIALSDPFSLIANPTTVNPDTNPQIILPNNNYKSLTIEIVVTESVRAALPQSGIVKLGFYVNYPSGAIWNGIMDIHIHAQAIPDQKKTTYSTEIPFSGFLGQDFYPIEFSVGLNTPFGSGYTFSGIYFECYITANTSTI